MQRNSWLSKSKTNSKDTETRVNCWQLWNGKSLGKYFCPFLYHIPLIATEWWLKRFFLTLKSFKFDPSDAADSSRMKSDIFRSFVSSKKRDGDNFFVRWPLHVLPSNIKFSGISLRVLSQHVFLTYTFDTRQFVIRKFIQWNSLK